MTESGLRAASISGSPGTGKSSVARGLGHEYDIVEVGDLAVGLGIGKRRGKTVELDLRRLRRQLEGRRPGAGRVYVGHLAHLLPVRDVVLLRCHPVELERRLRRAHRGSPEDRRANGVVEATDLILLEALKLRRRVWEVDTTGRSIPMVAREVASLLRSRPRPRYGLSRWLEDPRVTEHLLRPAR
ncbi:MAG: AAA family ATPase [Thermoplasmata archaeon]|nr:AAA family ATPase [Thermoplasmata archaeon]